MEVGTLSSLTPDDVGIPERKSGAKTKGFLPNGLGFLLIKRISHISYSLNGMPPSNLSSQSSGSLTEEETKDFKSQKEWRTPGEQDPQN